MTYDLSKARVAIVADWLTSRGGAERVVASLAELFPQADLFTTVYAPENFPEFRNRKVTASYLNGWPLSHKHQVYVWARPQAVESFNLDEYDIVISSASAEAKGVITKPATLHICYCHTPTRYFWSHYHEYLKRSEFGFLDGVIKRFVPGILHKLRQWDRLAADRVDFFIANSAHTQGRIQKYYRRPSRIIHPPVDLNRFAGEPLSGGDYYMVLGRQIAYKRTDLVVETFSSLDRPLKIVGDGPEIPRLKQLAKGHHNIEFLGRISDEQVAHCLMNCKALIFPQEEDFGIVAVEAMAAGKPVIAYGQGGGGESVVDGKTGVVFAEQTPASLRAAIERFERLVIDPKDCKLRSHEFSEPRFHQEISHAIAEWAEQFKERNRI